MRGEVLPIESEVPPSTLYGFWGRLGSGIGMVLGGLLMLPVMAVFLILVALLAYGVPLAAAGLWVVYGLYEVLLWWLGPDQPLLLIFLFLILAFPTGGAVFGLVYGMMGVLLPWLMSFAPASWSGHVPRWRSVRRARGTRTIHRREMVFLRKDELPTSAWQEQHPDAVPVRLVEEHITETMAPDDDERDR